MKKLLLLVFMLSFGFAQIKTVLTEKPSSDGVEFKYELNVYNDGKKIYSYSQEGGSIEKIASEDLDGDGYKEDVFLSYSGGAHCCFEVIVVSQNPDIKKPLFFDLRNTEVFELEDKDGDKIPEIVTFDDYGYMMGLCFACSPYVKIVMNYKNGKFYLRSDLIKKINAPQAGDVKVVFDEKNGYFYFSSDENASKTLSAVLHYIYAGEHMNALDIIKKHVTFDTPATKKLFLISLVENLGSSVFWNDIKRANGWETPYGLFDDYQIVDLFYKNTKGE